MFGCIIEFRTTASIRRRNELVPKNGVDEKTKKETTQKKVSPNHLIGRRSPPVHGWIFFFMSQTKLNQRFGTARNC